MFVCFRLDFLRCCLPILLKKQHFVDFRTIIYVLFAVCSSTFISSFHICYIRRIQVDNCNNRDWSTIIRMLQRFLYRRRSPLPGFVIGILPGTVHVHKVKHAQDYEGEYVDIERNSERISGSYFALNLYRTWYSWGYDVCYSRMFQSHKNPNDSTTMWNKFYFTLGEYLVLHVCSAYIFGTNSTMISFPFPVRIFLGFHKMK